jgi:hypothetical protein
MPKPCPLATVHLRPCVRRLLTRSADEQRARLPRLREQTSDYRAWADAEPDPEVAAIWTADAETGERAIREAEAVVGRWYGRGGY